MLLLFELNMPTVMTHNNKWSGEGHYYATVRKLDKSESSIEKGKEILSKGSFFYRFHDGWMARIDVKEIEPHEKVRAKKKSNNFRFLGYDWMVDSIMEYGDIVDLEKIEV